MTPAPTLDELAARAGSKDYTDFVKAAMRDFCFSISLHTGRERTWFGVYTLTINRNVAFNFFDRDISGDEQIERFPVVRSERTETVEIRVRPEPDDPSADYVVPVFNLERKEFDEAIRSLHDIDERLAGLRTIPDVCFDDEPLIKLAREKLLRHPAVIADRAADWPDLLA
jgi:hypothetical protein